MEKLPCVYILAKASHGTLYTGVTSDLPGRVWQHREGLIRGFTQRYGIKRLVWFERHDSMDSAIIREKRIKRWPRHGSTISSMSTTQVGAILPRKLDFPRCR